MTKSLVKQKKNLKDTLVSLAESWKAFDEIREHSHLSKDLVENMNVLNGRVRRLVELTKKMIDVIDAYSAYTKTLEEKLRTQRNDTERKKKPL